MNNKTRLLLIAALFALIVPMVLAVGSSEATTRYVGVMDGSGANSTGQNVITDPGSCNNYPAATAYTACKQHQFAGVLQPACETGACASGNPAHTDAATCNAAGYAWNNYGSWMAVTCSDPLYISEGACTTAAKTWTGAAACVGNYVWKKFYAQTGICTNPTYTTEATCNAAPADWYADNRASTGGECLKCHNTKYMEGGTAPTFGGRSDDYSGEIENFPMTGHKNVFRKVTPGNPYGGPFFSAGEPGSSAYTNILGSAKYIYNSWFVAINEAKFERLPMSDPTTVSQVSDSASIRTCFYCHTGDGGGTYAYQPTDIPTAAVKWGQNGIVCVTCHKSPMSGTSTGIIGGAPNAYTSGHAGTYFEGQPTVATALCLQCHRMEDTSAPISNPTVQANAFEIGEIGAEHANLGAQFLQSPHARFSGTFGEIAMRSKYDSHFSVSEPGCSDDLYITQTACTAASKTWGTYSTNRGCVGCHAVHTSAVDPEVLDPTSTLSNIGISDPDSPSYGQGSCGTGSCHAYISTSNINHPSGVNTPLDGNLSTVKGKLMACATCHMGPQTSHLFRINTDVTYSTVQNCSDTTYIDQFNCTSNSNTWTAGVPLGDDGEGIAMDLTLACGQCHYEPAASEKGALAISKAQLATYAVNMHNNMPVANFIWTVDSTTSKKVNFNGAGSNCPSGNTCTYAWDFGDTTTGTGVTTSKTYADTTPKNVTLTVTTNAHTTDSMTKSVTPININAAPVVGKTGLTFTNLTVSFTDASTDDVPATAIVYVNWGDGSPVATCGVIGSVCTKTYAAAGTYNITHYVKDAGGLLSGNDTFQAIVPAKFFVNVTTSAATQSALVQIKLGTMIKAQGYTSAAGTWTSLVKLPVGAYTATITKSGKTFDCDGAGLANNPVPVNITNADVTINCTVTP